jgi:hypothetical protein
MSYVMLVYVMLVYVMLVYVICHVGICHMSCWCSLHLLMRNTSVSKPHHFNLLDTILPHNSPARYAARLVQHTQLLHASSQVAHLVI